MITHFLFYLLFITGLSLAGLFVGTVGVTVALGVTLSFGLTYPEIAEITAAVIPFTAIGLPVLFPVLGIYALKH